MKVKKSTSPELSIKSVTKRTCSGKDMGAMITFILREDSGEEREETVTISCLPTEYLGKKPFFAEMESKGVIFYDTSQSYRVSLLEQLQKVPVNQMDILCQGVNTLVGERACLLGNTLILSDKSNLVCSDEYKQYKIKREVRAPFGFVLNFMQLAPQCPLLLTYVAVSVLEGYFSEESWLASRFALVLEGQTGAFKSTLARMVTNFDFQQNTLTLGSTKASLEARLDDEGNIPVLLDDFNLSAYGNSRKGIVLTEIIQAFTERHKLERRQGKEVIGSRMGGGIIITAEKMPTNHSTLNRCMIVEADSSTQIDTEKLSRLQEQSKRAMSELVTGFNLYILNHYDDVREAYKAQIEVYRDKKSLFPHRDETVFGYRRIVNTYAVAKAATEILCHYFQAKLLPKELVDSCRHELFRGIYESCEKLCCRLSKEEEISNTVLPYFLDDLECKSFALDEEEYCRKQGKCIGIMTKELLYIQGDCIDGLLKKNERDFTRHQLRKALECFGLLCIGSDGRKSVHFPGGVTKKRYYAIRYVELQEVVRTQRERFSDYIYELQMAQQSRKIH